MLTIGSLFSGVGGLDLGLERGLSAAGLEARTIWQVEANPFARAVLARHWPSAIRYPDVREVGDDLVPVDLLCGGFPCQDISQAGRQAGITADTRSGLFYELARIARVVRPRVLVLENVAAIVGSNDGADLAAVLGELAALGYDGWWDCVPAAAVGAPHRRDRWFFVGVAADTLSERPQRLLQARAAAGAALGSRGWSHPQPGMGGAPDGVPGRLDRPGGVAGGGVSWPSPAASLMNLTEDLEGWMARREATRLRVGNGNGFGEPLVVACRNTATPRPWAPWEGDIPRTAPRTPTTTPRLRALGNAVVPQVAEVIGIFVAHLLSAESR